MDNKEQLNSVEPQQAQPSAQPPAAASGQDQTAGETIQWQPKEVYEVHAGSPNYYASLRLTKMKKHGYVIDVFIGLALCLVLFLSSIPDLPSYTSPGSDRNIPATPIIGVAYLILEGLIIYRLILARRMNALKKNSQPTDNSVSTTAKKPPGTGSRIGRIALGVGLLCITFLFTPVGLIGLFLVIGPVYCNFTSCAAS